MKFGRFFAEILKSEYQEMSLWSPYWNLRCFQSEKQNDISIGKCKVSLDLKVGIFNSQNRCKVVVSNELGRQLEHFNWALFLRFIAESHTNPLQSICKSLYLKTETDKTCKIRINADSFSLTKILMKLMQSQWPLMSLGQLFFRFSIFSQSFLCNENCIDIFLSVASHCACRFEISSDAPKQRWPHCACLHKLGWIWVNGVKRWIRRGKHE